MKKILVLAAMLAVAAVSDGVASATLIVSGRVNNTTTDSFTFFSLEDMQAGKVYYFTDNGWTGTQFRGASATDGDGNENLIKFTANQSIAAGTVINSTATNAAWTWTTAGPVPGTTTGSFAHLALGQGGDQIYAFSGPENNPLFNPGTIHFVLDDTNGFENASSSSTGGRPTGVAGVSVNFAVPGGIRLINDGQSRTASDWIGYATDARNWEANSDINNGPFNIAPVPEPSALLLVGSVLGAGFLRRRRS